MNIDPQKMFELPESLQERDKYLLYSEMILQLQMARDHLLMQQSEKPVSCKISEIIHSYIKISSLTLLVFGCSEREPASLFSGNYQTFLMLSTLSTTVSMSVRIENFL